MSNTLPQIYCFIPTIILPGDIFLHTFNGLGKQGILHTDTYTSSEQDNSFICNFRARVTIRDSVTLLIFENKTKIESSDKQRMKYIFTHLHASFFCFYY